MLARTKLRYAALGSLRDESYPFGPTCDCVGPLEVDCDGKPIRILDSPTGYLLDRITNENEGAIGLPLIAIYAEDNGAIFQSGVNEPKIDTSLSLIVEIYVSGDSDWQAEDCLDQLHQKVLFRLMRETEVVFDGQSFRPLISMGPTAIRTDTTRENNDRRVFMRSIEISVTDCDVFKAPDCEGEAPFCVDVSTRSDCNNSA